MKSFLIALQFLTILPIKIKAKIKADDFGRSLLYFPAVGLVIGAILSLCAMIFSFLPNPVTGILVVVTSILITGAIHLDGLADTCDGFYGAKTKDGMLKIMRDSHAGVMAVIGVVSILLLKLVFISNIPQDKLWRSLMMMAVFSRWSQAAACCTCKYAREDGKAKLFIERADRRGLVLGGLFTFVLFPLLAGFNGIAIFALSYILIYLFIKYTRKKIGGMTGDTIGATNEIAEIAVLFFFLVLAS